MRILLVQHDPVLARSIVCALEQRSFVVEWTNDGLIAEKIVALEEFDALVIDVALPGKNGHELLLHIKTSGNNVPVLVLTADRSDADKLECFREGADDFMRAPVDLAELEARLLAVIRRSQKADSLSFQCGALTYDTRTRIFTLADAPLYLSPREHALLLALIQKSQQTISKQALFDRVFGKNDDVSIKTIEVIVWRLRKRLAASSVRIVNVRGFGYRLIAQDDPVRAES